jgi:hypothetical protein
MTSSFWVSDEIKEIIFGADWLEQNGCVWDFGKSVLMMQAASGEVRVPLLERTREPCVRRIFVRDNVEIPPKAQSNLPVKSIWTQLPLSDVAWTVEPREVQPGVMIARTLIAPSGSSVCVRVINCNSVPCQMTAGQFLSKAERVNVLPELEPHKTEVSIRHVQGLIDSLPEQLTREEKERAAAFIRSYAHAFSSSNTDLGRNRLVPHRINTGNRSPVRQPLRRQPYAHVAKIEENVQELLAAKLIEPTVSPWSSNVLLVKKKDGTMRFCVDYRKLNDRTVKDSYPLPRLDGCLESLGGNRIFSTLDLRAGYWQTELDPSDAEKTAFITRSGQYKFTVLSMGLMNAPSQFQRLMDLVLAGLLWDVCLAYLDDVIVFSRDFDQHLERLAAVLDRLVKANLKLKPSKCQLFQQEVRFLGHVISANGIATDPDKVKVVEEWPRPRNLHEVRSFLGLASYYRRFVAQFAEVARPLHLLTNKGQPFIWGDAQEEAFQSLKQRLTSAPILASPVDEAGYVLDTDASLVGLGAVLHQWQKGHLKVIGYASRVLSKAERNYSTTRRELLAVIFGFKQFRQFLLGRKFVLRVDHAALTQLRSTPDVVGQAARWLDFIGEYDFDIQHRSGAAHGNCDALSRRPERNESDIYCCPVQSTAGRGVDLTPEKIAEAQVGDVELSMLYNAVNSGAVRPSWISVQSASDDIRVLWAQYETLCVHQGMLCRKYLRADGCVKYLQIVMPVNMRELFLQQLHQTGGNMATTHLGIRKTQMHVQQRAYWPGWRSDVDRFCRKCAVCQSVQHGAAPRQGRLQTYEANGPMDRLHIDLTGPHPTSRQGSVYIFTAIDAFTRFLVAVPIKQKSAVVIATTLVEHLFLPFGTWRTIISDQGKEFCNEVLDKVASLLKVQKLRTTSYRPSANGRIERVHRTINNLMSKMVSEGQRDWQDCLPHVVAAYNAAQHETTNFSPFYLMYGREYRTPLDLVLNVEMENETSTGLDYTDQLRERYRQAFASVNSRMKTQTQRMKQRYDARVKERSFTEGDYVWYYVPRRKQGRNQKWRRLCDIFRVNRRFNDVLYQIQYSPRAKPILAHVDKLRRCDAELPKRWLASQNAPSSSVSQDNRGEVAMDAGSTIGPNVDSAVSPKLSPIGASVDSRRECSQAERESMKPRRSARARRPPARFRSLRNQPAGVSDIHHTLTNCRSDRIVKVNVIEEEMANASDNNMPKKRKYKYYPRNAEQKAKHRARESGSWTCERCDSSFTSVTGLQSHAVRVHGLHCDYHGHMTEFKNPARRRKMLRRLVQSESAGKLPEPVAVMIDSQSSRVMAAEIVEHTASGDISRPWQSESLAGNSTLAQPTDSVPSLACRVGVG